MYGRVAGLAQRHHVGQLLRAQPVVGLVVQVDLGGRAAGLAVRAARSRCLALSSNHAGERMYRL